MEPIDIDTLEELRGPVDALSLQRLIFEALVAGATLKDDAARAQLAAVTALRAFGHSSSTSSASSSSSSSSSASIRRLTGAIAPELDLWLDHLEQGLDSLRRRGVVKASTLAALRRLADEVPSVSDAEHAVVVEATAQTQRIVAERRARNAAVDDDAVDPVLALLTDLGSRR